MGTAANRNAAPAMAMPMATGSSTMDIPINGSAEERRRAPMIDRLVEPPMP